MSISATGVFPSRNGYYLRKKTADKAFHTAIQRAGLLQIRFYDLRHTHATVLLEKGIHPKIVSERLGHASVKITLDTYSHVLPTI